MKLAKQNTKKPAKKVNKKVWAVRIVAIVLALLFVLTGILAATM